MFVQNTPEMRQRNKRRQDDRSEDEKKVKRARKKEVMTDQLQLGPTVPTESLSLETVDESPNQ